MTFAKILRIEDLNPQMSPTQLSKHISRPSLLHLPCVNSDGSFTTDIRPDSFYWDCTVNVLSVALASGYILPDLILISL